MQSTANVKDYVPIGTLLLSPVLSMFVVFVL